MSVGRLLLSVLSATIVNGCRGDTPRTASTDAAAANSGAAVVDSATSDSLDLWTRSEVVKRLAEAGLVVSDSGVAEPFPPLREAGGRLFVSGSELRVYLFPDAPSRRAASASLDTLPPERGYAQEWRSRPRVILVNNLIALHFTPNDRLAERVENVLRARHLGR